MPKRFLGFASAALSIVMAASSVGRADDMDVQLSRLSRSDLADGCERTLSSAGSRLTLRDSQGDQILRPDNTRWRQLITQLTPAVAPAVLAPVTTSGPSGFDVSFETNVTGIDRTARYWKTGSRGHGPSARATCDGENRFVDSTLVSNRLHFAKGLPLGITLGATVGALHDSSLWIAGADIKLALVEGLRTWAVPDLAVRLAVNTVVGDSQFSLTTAALDGVLSKNLVAGRVVMLSPYLGGGALLSFASSELIDLTPNIDAVRCAAGDDPVCNRPGSLGASQDDVGHDVAFRELTLLRYRGFLGLHMRYKVFALSAELLFDVVSPSQSDAQAGPGTPRQWTVSAAPSLVF